jgi:predicted RNA-binding protein with RPS1 domain
VVEGTVTRLEKYGAFVNLGLADRRDGLIHISEMSPHRIRRVEDVVNVGDSVRARVVSVDLGRGRIALSLNDVDAETAKEASVGPAEPALTSMAMAFQEAQNRQRERDERGRGGSSGEGRVGDRKRREQEELMRRLQEGQ